MKERRQILEKNVTVIPNKIMLSETNFLRVCDFSCTCCLKCDYSNEKYGALLIRVTICFSAFVCLLLLLFF